jgi:hypothetical protein
MHKNATKCNETLNKWCKNKHGASKIVDTFETYQGEATTFASPHEGPPDAPSPIEPLPQSDAPELHKEKAPEDILYLIFTNWRHRRKHHVNPQD